MRHFLRTTLVDRSAEERNLILEPILELNPCHDLVIHLHKVIAKSPSRDPGASNEIAVAESLLEHLLENGLAQAGLLDDLRNLSSKSINIITQMVRLLNQEKICTS
ncbi:unnamed protein product [Protopolystoma xenopodis]|uniref:Uncharacterized protein n=1 Tax=Protopolystoma xenopodis TaxID=117903 RepID=A0A448X674_9PLAT|nr:unnamed protein product [Protopolystoma xenopodis]